MLKLTDALAVPDGHFLFGLTHGEVTRRRSKSLGETGTVSVRVTSPTRQREGSWV